jgi:hypothetical protein
MKRILDIAYTTITAELLERALDAQFDIDFDEAGTFKTRKVKEREYWYYRPSEKVSDQREKYVGRTDDPQITERIENFANIKNDYQSRRKIVSTLIRDARLFKPENRVGNVIDALWKAGVFRLRACLIGTIAYQTYGTVLGYRLADAAMQTGDTDLAQFYSISLAVGDSIPPILDVLQTVDKSFKPLPQLDNKAAPTRFAGSGGLRVEFLTPNMGSDDQAGKPLKLPALGGAGGEPLRYLDYLINEPIRTVMLHKGGIPILVPQPARYAVHKLIVADQRRKGRPKDIKDLRQVHYLTEALVALARTDELKEAYAEANERGAHWRSALKSSIERLASLGMVDFAASIGIKGSNRRKKPQQARIVRTASKARA